MEDTIAVYECKSSATGERFLIIATAGKIEDDHICWEYFVIDNNDKIISKKQRALNLNDVSENDVEDIYCNEASIEEAKEVIENLYYEQKPENPEFFISKLAFQELPLKRLMTYKLMGRFVNSMQGIVSITRNIKLKNYLETVGNLRVNKIKNL